MPRSIVIDDERPRRRRAPAPVAIERDPNVIMRVLLNSPKDTVAGLVAAAGVAAIIANAIFLQPHRHPSPMFGSKQDSLGIVQAQPLPRSRPVDARPTENAAIDVRPVDAKPAPAEARASEIKPSAVTTTPRPPMPVPSGKRADPVGDLINSSRRVASVQRALTEYGYGQLKPTGVIGLDTQSAIQKFERERKMPVTGQLSDRLVHDLSVLTGRPLE